MALMTYDVTASPRMIQCDLEPPVKKDGGKKFARTPASHEAVWRLSNRGKFADRVCFSNAWSDRFPHDAVQVLELVQGELLNLSVDIHA